MNLESQWRREALRTNLWLVPTIEVVAAAGLFAVTRAFDKRAYDGRIQLPSWVISGSADAARQILTALAAAEITVVGIVFSITMVTLTLASTQFGPRMLRNFIRDRGTQITLGTYVATFVYAILALVAIGPGSHGDFVPHISVTVALALIVIDLGVLIFFIHHIAVAIQLPQVIAGIAHELSDAIEAEACPDEEPADEPNPLPAVPGGVVAVETSGYLQLIATSALVRVATDLDAVIHVRNRPGHFITSGQPFATVWPASAAPDVARALHRAHLTGSNRILTQDIAFAVDQLVEIAIRALSSAVNDTFTALTCIDWLGDSLCKTARGWRPRRVHRDPAGVVRLVTEPIDFDRLVERSFEKIRQAGLGMPAIYIRQLDALAKIASEAPPDRQAVLHRQADMIRRAAQESISEPADLDDVLRRYAQLGPTRLADGM